MSFPNDDMDDNDTQAQSDELFPDSTRDNIRDTCRNSQTHMPSPKSLLGPERGPGTLVIDSVASGSNPCYQTERAKTLSPPRPMTTRLREKALIPTHISDCRDGEGKLQGHRSAYSEDAEFEHLQTLQNGVWINSSALKFALDFFNPDRTKWAVLEPGIAPMDGNFAGRELRSIRSLRDSTRWLVVPLNIRNSHWIVAIIGLHARSVEVYDPLRDPHSIQAAFDALQPLTKTLERLRPIQSEGVNSGEWSLVDEMSSPLFQAPTDHTECGVYVLIHAASKMHGRVPPRSCCTSVWRMAVAAGWNAMRAHTDNGVKSLVIDVSINSLAVLPQQYAKGCETAGQDPGVATTTRLRDRLNDLQKRVNEMDGALTVLETFSETADYVDGLLMATATSLEKLATEVSQQRHFRSVRSQLAAAPVEGDPRVEQAMEAINRLIDASFLDSELESTVAERGHGLASSRHCVEQARTTWEFKMNRLNRFLVESLGPFRCKQS